jgi:hypothetical protein
MAPKCFIADLSLFYIFLLHDCLFLTMRERRNLLTMVATMFMVTKILVQILKQKVANVRM